MRFVNGALLISLAAAAAASEGPVLDLISTLQHAHENRIDVHEQAHVGERTWRSHRHLQAAADSSGGSGAGTALTRSNTKPLRVKLNFDSLYEDKAPQYSACFAVGAWFRRGLPAAQTPPADGVETCVRGEGEGLSHNGCWGKCRDYDLITPADRDRLIEAVTEMGGSLGRYLAVRPTENLKFEVGRGAYDRALLSKGYTPVEACASDCATLSRAAVDPRYCDATGGLASGYDAVLSVTKPPGVAGVAGTGSACASDQRGRPLWLVVAWHQSIVGYAAKSATALATEHRGFFRHEALHGLGFINSFFNYARDARGQRKRLIELRPVVDTDGARDEVWHFVRGRAYELGALYFQCNANATATDPAQRAWDGVPLMGLPEAGRGAHWETRIMRDDVMSYGFRDFVSSITLAAMEDLGFYLANYSSADCMRWGRAQGCAYVKTRCGVATNDRSQVLSSASKSKCKGDPFWSTTPDRYLAAKCAHGTTPCATTASSGYVASAPLPGGSGSTGPVCDAQCAGSDPTPTVVDETCSAAPVAQPEGALNDVADELLKGLGAVRWEAWLIPCIWLLALCAIGSFIRATLCPKSHRSRWIAISLCILTLICAIAGLVGTAYVFVQKAVFEAFVGGQSMLVAAILCGVHALFAIAMLVALCVHSPCALRLGFWTLMLLVLLEVAGTLLIVYWVFSLGSVPTDALTSLLGNAHSQAITGVFSQVLSEPVALAEGIVCKTYQTCCRDPKLDLILLASNATNDVVGGVDQTGGGGGGGGGDAGSGELGSGNTYATTTLSPPTNTSTHCLAPAQHEGATTDLELTLRDPSTENFCAYTSGAPSRLLLAPPYGTCLLLQELGKGDGFSLPQCRNDFCETGIDGYISFLDLVVRLIQKYAVPVTAAISTLLLLQLIFAFNLRRAAKLDRTRKSVQKHRTTFQNNNMPVNVSHL